MTKRKVAKKRSPVKARKPPKSKKSTKKPAKARRPTPKQASDWIARNFSKAAKQLAAERKRWGKMARLTDDEGFVIITPRHRKLSRKEAAQLGWVNRRAKQFQANGVSFIGSHDWAQLSKDRADTLERLTQDTLGLNAWSWGRERVNFVRAGLEQRDRRFVLYMRMAQEMGYTERQARTALFSPRARPIAPAE